MINLYGLEMNKLIKLMEEEGQKPYRATQLYSWIYEKKAESFDEMSDISKSFREVLKEKYCLDLPTVYTKQVSKDGTIKLLVELKDGYKVECVLMRYSYGCAVCVSSQVGCNMGCSFCSSGILGKQRNLAPEEMMGQILLINKLLKEENKGQHVTHVVVMGTGEPFDNYDNVLDFIRILNHPKGLAIGARHITISTCGLVPMIDRFTDLDLQVNLSVSLHAATDDLRKQLMPIARKYGLSELMDACRRYVSKTNRRLTFEYSLFANVNDSEKDAETLVRLLGKGLWHVNLIAANEFPGSDYHTSPKHRVRRFQEILESGDINATLRREMGTDIMAACGQLRRGMETKDQ